MMKRRNLGVATFILGLVMCCSASYAEGQLVLEAHLYQSAVVERCPLVARLTVRNGGDSTVMTIFREGRSVILPERAALLLRDIAGRSYALRYRGGPIAERPAPIPIHPMDPGAIRMVDRLVSLVIPTKRAGHYDFLAPGEYTGHFEVALLHGEKLVSDEFELTILEAKGVDALAREHIQFRHVGFLEGRDQASDESFYDGRKSWKKVDVSRFGELQKILDDFPDSEYAKWIRFWKLYHHGPVDEALEYARTHKDFPLSDNLMLRMAERLFNRASKYDFAAYRRVRELGRELLRDFPEGDARPRVERLLKRLKNKLPPEDQD